MARQSYNLYSTATRIAAATDLAEEFETRSSKSEDQEHSRRLAALPQSCFELERRTTKVISRLKVNCESLSKVKRVSSQVEPAATLPASKGGLAL